MELTKTLKILSLASSSPWIITEPVIIDNAAYIDGGLLDTYPIRDLKKAKPILLFLLVLTHITTI